MLRDYLEDKAIFDRGEESGMEVKEGAHTIEVRNLCFTYPGGDKPIFSDLSLTISAGETCALVGLNGSGKSTFVNMLLRLYKPDSWEILLDGVNIEKYDVHSYYKAIACVFQSTTKYAMPIRDYIASGKDCDIDRAKAAVNEVRLGDWCRELPHGLDTMLTCPFTSESDSVEPSIGQWQKLSIARAIYKDSSIMILDELSASLDVDSENVIFSYIERLFAKKTALLISHRLSNVVGCDKIFLIIGGRLVEEGSHRELMEKRRRYAELFMSQAEMYKAG